MPDPRQVRGGGAGPPAARGVRGGVRDPVGRVVREGRRVPFVRPGDGKRDAHPGGPRRAGHAVRLLRDVALRAVDQGVRRRSTPSIYYLDSARKERVIAQWRGESERYVRFFVALWVPDDRGNDLEKPGIGLEPAAGPVGRKGFRAGVCPEVLLEARGDLALLPVLRHVVPGLRGGVPEGGGTAAEPAEGGTPRLKLVLAGVQGRAVLAWR